MAITDTRPRSRRPISSFVTSNEFSPFVNQFPGAVNFSPALDKLEAGLEQTDVAKGTLDSLKANVRRLDVDNPSVSQYLDQNFNVEDELINDPFASSKIDAMSREFSAQLKSPTSFLGAAQSNFDRFQTGREKIEQQVQKGDIDTETGEFLTRRMLQTYNQGGGLGTDAQGQPAPNTFGTFNQLQTLQGQKTVDIPKRVNELLKGFAADQGAEVFASFTPNGQLEIIEKLSGSTTTRTLNEEEIQQRILPILQQDNELNAFFRQQALVDFDRRGEDAVRTDIVRDLETDATRQLKLIDANNKLSDSEKLAQKNDILQLRDEGATTINNANRGQLEGFFQNFSTNSRLQDTLGLAGKAAFEEVDKNISAAGIRDARFGAGGSLSREGVGDSVVFQGRSREYDNLATRTDFNNRVTTNAAEIQKLEAELAKNDGTLTTEARQRRSARLEKLQSQNGQLQQAQQKAAAATTVSIANQGQFKALAKRLGTDDKQLLSQVNAYLAGDENALSSYDKEQDPSGLDPSLLSGPGTSPVGPTNDVKFFIDRNLKPQYESILQDQINSFAPVGIAPDASKGELRNKLTTLDNIASASASAGSATMADGTPVDLGSPESIEGLEGFKHSEGDSNFFVKPDGSVSIVQNWRATDKENPEVKTVEVEVPSDQFTKNALAADLLQETFKGTKRKNRLEVSDVVDAIGRSQPDAWNDAKAKTAAHLLAADTDLAQQLNDLRFTTSAKGEITQQVGNLEVFAFKDPADNQVRYVLNSGPSNIVDKLGDKELSYYQVLSLAAMARQSK